MTSEVDKLVEELMTMTAPAPKRGRKLPSTERDPRILAIEAKGQSSTPDVLPEHYINGNRRGLDAPAGYETAKRRAMLVKLIGSNESFQREALSFCVIIVEQKCSCCGAVNEYVGSQLIETWASSRKLRAWVNPSEVPPSDKRDLPVVTKRIQHSVDYCPSCAELLEGLGTGIPWIQPDMFVTDEAERATAEANAARDKVLNKLLKGLVQ